MKKRLFLVLYTSLYVAMVFGQDFKGVIVNAKQRPLKGIKVWKKNTTESVKTDNMGVFSFSGLQPTDTLVVSISKKEEAISYPKLLLNWKRNFSFYSMGRKKKKENIPGYSVQVITQMY